MEAYLKGQNIQADANSGGYGLQKNAFQSIIQGMRGSL